MIECTWVTSLKIYWTRKDHLYKYTHKFVLRFRYSRPVGTVVRKAHQAQYPRSQKRKEVQLLPWNTSPAQNQQPDWRCRCVCVWRHQFLAYFEFYTLLCFYTSVFVIPRSQTCPVNSRKCNFTGSNSLRLCAAVKQLPQPAVINAGMASPKPGITSFGVNLKCSHSTIRGVYSASQCM